VAASERTVCPWPPAVMSEYNERLTIAFAIPDLRPSRWSSAALAFRGSLKAELQPISDLVFPDS
jgi:hypothetical protein